MTALLLSLLSNPTILAIVAGILGALGFGLHQRRVGAKAERNANRAKEADAYEQHLKDIAAANRARNAVQPNGLPDDKYRRD